MDRVTKGCFYSCRQLHCDRVTIHKNLFTSYILNGLSWILYYTLAAMDPHVVDSNPVSSNKDFSHCYSVTAVGSYGVRMGDELSESPGLE